MADQREGFQKRKNRLEGPEMRVARDSIAARLKAARKSQGLTQEQAAAAAEMDVRGWQRLETGKAENPTLLSLLDASRALGLSLAELVELDPES